MDSSTAKRWQFLSKRGALAGGTARFLDTVYRHQRRAGTWQGTCETRSVRTHSQAKLCTPSPFGITPRVSTFPHMKRCGGTTYRNTLYQVCNEAVGTLLS